MPLELFYPAVRTGYSDTRFFGSHLPRLPLGKIMLAGNIRSFSVYSTKFSGKLVWKITGD